MKIMKVLNKKRTYGLCQHIDQNGRMYIGQINTAKVSKKDIKTNTNTFMCSVNGKVFENYKLMYNLDKSEYFILTVSIINSWPHLDKMVVYKDGAIVDELVDIPTYDAEMFLSEVIIKSLFVNKQNVNIIDEEFEV